MDEFFAKDYKMKEETKFIITTNKNTFRVLLSPPKKTTAANTTAENML